jgi:hypothetical protein
MRAAAGEGSCFILGKIFPIYTANFCFKKPLQYGNNIKTENSANY